jgi:hypothetical protein
VLREDEVGDQWYENVSTGSTEWLLPPGGRLVSEAEAAALRGE